MTACFIVKQALEHIFCNNCRNDSGDDEAEDSDHNDNEERWEEVSED